jgi:hypothetical protein
MNQSVDQRAGRDWWPYSGPPIVGQRATRSRAPFDRAADPRSHWRPAGEPVAFAPRPVTQRYSSGHRIADDAAPDTVRRIAGPYLSVVQSSRSGVVNRSKVRGNRQNRSCNGVAARTATIRTTSCNPASKTADYALTTAGLRWNNRRALVDTTGTPLYQAPALLTLRRALDAAPPDCSAPRPLCSSVARETLRGRASSTLIFLRALPVVNPARVRVAAFLP